MIQKKTAATAIRPTRLPLEQNSRTAKNGGRVNSRLLSPTLITMAVVMLRQLYSSSFQPRPGFRGKKAVHMRVRK